MDPLALVLYCRFKQERVPITLYKHMCFADVLHIVCDRFKLSRYSVWLSYLGLRDESCFLRTDEEMNDMISLFGVLGNKLVEVIVSESSFVMWNGGVSVENSSVIDETDCCDAESSTSALVPVYKTAEWVSCITGVGQILSEGAVEFRDALRKHCIYSGYMSYFEKNNKEKVIVFCREKASTGCEWGIKASSKIHDKEFKIRRFDPEHTCVKLGPTDPNKELNSKLVAGLVRDFVRDNPTYAAGAVMSRLRLDYGLHISYFKAWNAVQMAKDMNIGQVDDSYKYLEMYIEALASTNPGSRVVLEVVPFGVRSNRFHRLFLAFGGCLEGFKHVRPLLFIDGTFLKGKFKGTLLLAVGKNGNRGLYPLAFAFVDAENIDNWEWFLEQLKITVGNSRRITFFSDRHPGLLEGMARVFPDSVHCFCLQHLKDNLKTRFSGGDVFFAKTRSNYVQMLGECVKVPTVELLNQKLKELLDEGGPKMIAFIHSLELEKWTEAHSPVCRYGETTSNAVESFNNWILELRDLSITEMIDKVRQKLMKWFDERSTMSGKWSGILCKWYEDKWNKSVHESLSLVILNSSDTVFEVLSTPSQCVDLAKKICSCHQWKVDGFPCSHVVVCIIRRKLEIKYYVEEWFFADTYRKSYSFPINPVPTSIWRDSELVNKSNIKPPKTKNPPGRPKKKRIPSFGEVVSRKKTTIRCGRCKKYANHNKRSCKAEI